MRAVTGSVVSTKSISVSRAALTLNQFVDSDTAAKPEVAAYLRRAAVSFNELLEFYDRIKHGEDENAGDEGMEEERKDKKGEGQSLVGLGTEQDGGDGGLEREIGDGDLASEKKKKKKRKRDKIDGLDRRVENGMNLERETGDLGDGEMVNSEVDLSRKKKKRKKIEKEREIEEN